MFRKYGSGLGEFYEVWFDISKIHFTTIPISSRSAQYIVKDRTIAREKWWHQTSKIHFKNDDIDPMLHTLLWTIKKWQGLVRRQPFERSLVSAIGSTLNPEHKKRLAARSSAPRMCPPLQETCPFPCCSFLAPTPPKPLPTLTWRWTSEQHAPEYSPRGSFHVPGFLQRVGPPTC